MIENAEVTGNNFILQARPCWDVDTVSVVCNYNYRTLEKMRGKGGRTREEKQCMLHSYEAGGYLATIEVIMYLQFNVLAKGDISGDS